MQSHLFKEYLAIVEGVLEYHRIICGEAILGKFGLMESTMIKVVVVLSVLIGALSTSTPVRAKVTLSGQRSERPLVCSELQEQRRINLENARTTHDPAIKKLSERMLMDIDEDIKRTC